MEPEVRPRLMSGKMWKGSGLENCISLLTHRNMATQAKSQIRLLQCRNIERSVLWRNVFDTAPVLYCTPFPRVSQSLWSAGWFARIELIQRGI